jgi:arylsulfatase A-like enzyme/Tfp pilus assembly protein PilF
MTRGRLAASGLIILAAVIGGWRWLSREDARPSILLVTIDTLRADHVGAYGSGRARTPTLDALAANGIRFDAACATAPLTLPSHVSMLSGLLPVAHTVRTNDGYRVPTGVTLVSEHLASAGYRTGAFVGAAVLRRDTGIDRGFQTFDDTGELAERRAGAVIERAMAWLRAGKARPFFLWVHLYDPHLPYDPPAPHTEAATPYAGEIEYVDAALRPLLEAAEALGPELAVIVASDHGEGLGDHGELSHGALLYEETIRVPLIMNLPRAQRRGTVESRPVTTAGVAATMLRLARLPAHGLAGDILAASGDPIVAETLYLKQQLGWSPLYAVRDGTKKAIDAPRRELYDLATDPGERRNLAPSRADEAAALNARLHQELDAAAHLAVAASDNPADSSTQRQLAALGYVSGGRTSRGVEAVGGVNPVERMAAWIAVEAALARAQAGALDEAAALFEQILANDPDNVLAIKFLGAYATDHGDLTRGIALNERLLGTGLHTEEARRNLEVAYMRQGAELARTGRTQAGIAVYRRVVALADGNLDAHERLGALLHREGAAAEARREFELVLSRDPHRRAPALSLAILLLEAGQLQDAIVRLEPLTAGWEGAAQAQTYLREARRLLESR